MARTMTLRLHDTTTFKIPVEDKREDGKLVLSYEGGWLKVEGTDGQVVMCHPSTLAYAHVQKETT